MKKFILGGAFAAALVLGAAYSYNNSNAGLSDLQVENIEALADDGREWSPWAERWCDPGSYKDCNFSQEGKLVERNDGTFKD